jgi:NAD(P)-dependent dehydrogenase (short-subunit alcohol dehydrogenase family)
MLPLPLADRKDSVGTYVISGSASGMGAATTAQLRAAGHRVIGIDVRDADVLADLSTEAGRAIALDAVRATADKLDGAALFAGVGGATGRDPRLLVSLNYFGSVQLFEGMRPLLAGAGTSSAVAISSNSVTCQPGWNTDLVDACLTGDEALACKVATDGDSATAYPATKAALARWVRRTAPGSDWAGAGIRLNAVAPGLVETPFVTETRNDPLLGQLIGGFPLPLGRGGTADEVAAFVVFLLTGGGTFFCGSFLVCDGGTEALLRPDDWPQLWPIEFG